MTISLSLPPELESRLRSEAARRGETVEGLAVRLLEESLVANPAKDAEEMLLRWANEADELPDDEAAENIEVLRAIDADRTSQRPLFPDLKE